MTAAIITIPLEDCEGIIKYIAGKVAGVEDKVDLEDFKVEDFKAKTYNRCRRVIYGQIRSALSIIKLATGL